jgi:hypothetical protein
MRVVTSRRPVSLVRVQVAPLHRDKWMHDKSMAGVNSPIDEK